MRNLFQKTRAKFRVKGDAFAVTLLLLCAYKFVYKISRAADIVLFDESNYLHWGVNLRLSADGWVYLLWYKLLSWLQSDPVALYFLNYKLLLVLAPLLFYMFLRRLGLRTIAASAAALFLMLSALMTESWPYITKFALCLTLLVAVIVLRVRHTGRRLLIMAGGALVLAYTRPEFFPAFVLLWLLGAAYLAREIIRARKGGDGIARESIMGLVVLAAFMALTFIIGNPMDKGRTVHAFGQHFAINYVHWNPSNLSPAADYQIILRKVFGAANSIPGFFRANPGAFLDHVSFNFARTFFSALTNIQPVTSGPNPAGSVFQFAFVLVLLFSVYAGVARRRRIMKLARRRRVLLPLLFPAILAAPSLVSLLVIFPRAHYLILPMTLLFAIALGVIAYSGLLRARFKGPWTFFLVPLLIFILPYAALRRPGFGEIPDMHAKNACTVLNRIRALKALGLKRKVNVLDTLGGVHIFLGRNYHYVSDLEKNRGFIAYEKKHAINMVLIAPRLRKAVRFGDDPEFMRLMDKPESMGYRRLPFGGCKGEFILWKDRE